MRRKSPQRLAFTSIDRMVFAGLYRLAPGALDALKIVRPETVIRWHRAGFRAYWRWKSGRRSGRPAGLISDRHNGSPDLERVQRAADRCYASRDYAEGRAAQREKRKPVFQRN
jgi:hypothetical protein